MHREVKFLRKSHGPETHREQPWEGWKEGGGGVLIATVCMRAECHCWRKGLSLNLGIQSEAVRIKHLAAGVDWINAGLQDTDTPLEVFFSKSVVT